MKKLNIIKILKKKKLNIIKILKNIKINIIRILKVILINQMKKQKRKKIQKKNIVNQKVKIV